MHFMPEIVYYTFVKKMKCLYVFFLFHFFFLRVVHTVNSIQLKTDARRVKMVKDVYKTKNSHFNSSTTSKKRIIIQQTQTNPRFNSPIKVLKRSKSRQQPPIATGKRSISPTKLPTVAQKTSVISKIFDFKE